MSDQGHPERLLLARAALQIDWAAGDLGRLVAGLDGRRRARRNRRLVAGAMAVALVAIVAFSLDRRRSGPDLAPPLGPSLARVQPSPGPLADLARDRLQAETLLASYARAPDTHPTLPNVRYAGYHQGEAPAAAAPLINVKAPPFRAAGDGVTDDTEAIRRALGAVERGGGVIYFPDGQYLISGVLFVHGSGTVLRGESRDGTRLLFTRPLAAALGFNADDHGDSRWQGTGGLVWFVPRKHYTYPASGRELSWRGDGPVGAQFLGVMTASRLRGDRTLEVENAGRVRAGALVVVAVDASDALVTAGWRREPRPGVSEDFARVRWPVEVAAVDGSTVTLRQPLRFDLPLALHPRLEGLPEESVIRECGLERMTLVMRRDGADRGSIESVGWNGPFFQDAFHGFMREVTVVGSDQTFGAVASKNLTIARVKASASGPPEATPPASPRGFTIRASSHDVLVEDVELDPRYRFRARLEGSGIALSRVTGRLQPLTGRAVDTVLTDLSGWRPPASSSDVLTGERVIGWRITDGGPAAPGNLHDLQRGLINGAR
jgi:hypothetical protein